MKRAFEIILLAFALFASFAANAGSETNGPAKLERALKVKALDRWQEFYMHHALKQPPLPNLAATNTVIITAWKGATNGTAATNFIRQVRATIDGFTAKNAKDAK